MTHTLRHLSADIQDIVSLKEHYHLKIGFKNTLLHQGHQKKDGHPSQPSYQ